MKRLLLSILLGSLSSVAFAADDSTSTVEIKKQGLRSWTVELDDTNLKNYFQDLKNFLALTELKNNQNVAALRYTPPPKTEQSMYSGSKMGMADKAQAEPLRNFINRLSQWNTLTGGDNGLVMDPGQEPVMNVTDLEFVISRLAYGCSAKEAEAGLCTNPRAGWDKPYDLEAVSLLGNTDLSSVELQQTAYEYIKNLTNPMPMPLLTQGELFSDPNEKTFSDEGAKNLATHFKQQTLLSLAQYSFAKLYAERLPYTVSGGEAVDSAVKTASELRVLEYESKRRYEDGNWHTTMNTLPTEAILREIASMMALQLAMNYKQHEQLSRMEALMAAQVAKTAYDMSAVAAQ